MGTELILIKVHLSGLIIIIVVLCVHATISHFPIPMSSFSHSHSSWVKKYGEHNGLDALLKTLKACSTGAYALQGKDAVLRRMQYQCVRSLKAFMNNRVRLTPL